MDGNDGESSRHRKCQSGNANNTGLMHDSPPRAGTRCAAEYGFWNGGNTTMVWGGDGYNHCEPRERKTVSGES